MNVSRGSSRSPKFLLGLFLMGSDLATTLAQFLPMKSVFILGAGEVPGFFPQIFIFVGPVLTAMSLVAVAALMAALSKILRDLALGIESSLKKSHGSKGKPAFPESGGNEPHMTVKEISNFALIVVLVAVSAGVSFTFALGIVVWIAGSAIVLGIGVHRGVRKPPYPNGRLQFDATFRKWMADSSLWSVVGVAIFTLVVSFPPLGLTAILLGAVLLRRAQQAVPEVVPWILARFAPGETSDLGFTEVSRPTQAPYDFLATSAGQRLLRDSLRDLNYDCESWQVCAHPNNFQVTIICRHLQTGHLDLIRLFAPNTESSRDHEWMLRHDFDEFLPTQATANQRLMVAGLPALTLSFSDGDHPVLKDQVNGKEALDWQLDWEIRASLSQSFQEVLADFAVNDPKQTLFPLMITASRVSGSHSESVNKLIGKLDDIRRIYLDGPRVLSLGGPVSATNFVRLNSGVLEPVDLSSWRVGLLGSEWGESPDWIRGLADRFPGSDGKTFLLGARVRSHVGTLTKSLRQRESQKITKAAEKLLQDLNP